MVSNIYYFCEVCDDTTLHRIFARKTSVKKLSAKAQCIKCKSVRKVLVDRRHITLPVVVSIFEKSIRKSVKFDATSKISVRDRFYIDDELVEVTCLDLKSGIRIKKGGASADEITTIWAKIYDKILLKISVASSKKTEGVSLVVSCDKKIRIGEIIRLNSKNISVYKIRLKSRTLDKGSALARDIVRVYCREL
jgi:uncharacterized Zn finger protein